MTVEDHSSKICCVINQDHGQRPHVKLLCGLLMLLTIGIKSLKISMVVKSSVLLLRWQYTHLILINMPVNARITLHQSISHYWDITVSQSWIKGRYQQFSSSSMYLHVRCPTGIHKATDEERLWAGLASDLWDRPISVRQAAPCPTTSPRPLLLKSA